MICHKWSDHQHPHPTHVLPGSLWGPNVLERGLSSPKQVLTNRICDQNVTGRNRHRSLDCRAISNDGKEAR